MTTNTPPRPASTEPAIAIDALSHRYPGAETDALDDIALTIPRGTMAAVLGPNGSGKSTLFKILTTALKPSGRPNVIPRITLLGHDLRVAGHTIRQSLGVVFQSPSLDRELTVRENLTLQGRIYGLTNQQLKQQVPARLETLGIIDRADDKVATLSGGLARRAELAKALLHNPRILILDEPSTGVDPTARRQFWHALDAERKRSGITILMTTHLTDEAEHADHVIILDKGRIVAEGSPAQLKTTMAGGNHAAVLTLATLDPDDLHPLINDLNQHHPVTPLPERLPGEARLETPNGPAAMRYLLDHHQPKLRSATLAEPTLEDTFEHTTGNPFKTN
ncbi:MAG: ABC transporter ATP-binding protein [Phycisphaeraceae bacterium]